MAHRPAGVPPTLPTAPLTHAPSRRQTTRASTRAPAARTTTERSSTTRSSTRCCTTISSAARRTAIPRLQTGPPNPARMRPPLHPRQQPRTSHTRTPNIRANTHATAAHIMRATCVRALRHLACHADLPVPPEGEIPPSGERALLGDELVDPSIRTSHSESFQVIPSHKRPYNAILSLHCHIRK